MTVHTLQATQAKRLEALKCSFSKEVKLIVAPICAADHWSLLAVLQTGEEAEVTYFDSLSVTDAANLQLASFLLEAIRPDLKQDLEPASHAKQQAGTAVCGCFVMFWIEQKCRQLKGESPTSLGWPCSKPWSEKIKKLMKALAELQVNLKADAAKKAEKDAKAVAKAKATVEKALKSQKGKETAESLAKAAAKSIADVPKSKPCLENLSADAKHHIQLVKVNGVGVCSKCRFRYGCLECDADKALKYHLKKEFPNTFEGNSPAF
jgi:hypothetical protein